MIKWTHWHTEPTLIGGLLLIAWVYALLVGPWRDRIHPFPRKEARFFAAALITFYLAVGSPLDALGENFSFSAHMVQHNILMYIVPPLFLLGLPQWQVDDILKRHGRLRRVLRFFVNPLIAGVLFTLLFSLWHVPVLYEAGLRYKPIHILEHLMMFLPSLCVFWGILGPSRVLPALRPGGQAAYVFLLMVGQTPIFAFLTFGSTVFYPTYAYAPRIFGLSPLEDQIIGGIIMKAANMLVSLCILGRCFYIWNREQSEAQAQEHNQPEIVYHG